MGWIARDGTVPAMRGTEVVVVGSLNRDLIVETDRRPAAGETVLGRSLSSAQGGKGANQAAAAARAGARVAMVGCVGDDAAGAELLGGLERAGVEIGTVRVLEGETSGAAVIVVDGAGENSIVVIAGANARLAAADVEHALAEAAPAVVLAQLEVPEEAVAQAARGGARLVLNASPVRALPGELLAAADPLIVNAGEAAALAADRGEGDAGPGDDADPDALAAAGPGDDADPDALAAAGPGDDADPDALAAALLARGARSVVITLGADGARWTTQEGTIACPAPRVDVVDTTGAGDVFAGTLAARLSRGAAPRDALAAAVAAGAEAVGWLGAQPG